MALKTIYTKIVKGKKIMFNNIGEKIKKLAEVLCYIGILLSAIVGLVVMFVGGSSRSRVPLLIGLLIIFIGALISWVGSFFTYGFGELIVKVTEIEKNMHFISEDPKINSKQKDEQVETIKNEDQQPQVTSNINNTIIPSGQFGKFDYRKVEKHQTPSDNEWICPECVRENDNTIKTCKCGYQRIDSI